jgi:hypothetical protein
VKADVATGGLMHLSAVFTTAAGAMHPLNGLSGALFITAERRLVTNACGTSDLDLTVLLGYLP